MDDGAISFDNHQCSVVMKEDRFGGVDGNVSTTFRKDVNTLHSRVNRRRRPHSSSCSSNIFLLLNVYLLNLHRW